MGLDHARSVRADGACMVFGVLRSLSVAVIVTVAMMPTAASAWADNLHDPGGSFIPPTPVDGVLDIHGSSDERAWVTFRDDAVHGAHDPEIQVDAGSAT